VYDTRVAFPRYVPVEESGLRDRALDSRSLAEQHDRKRLAREYFSPSGLYVFFSLFFSFFHNDVTKYGTRETRLTRRKTRISLSRKKTFNIQRHALNDPLGERRLSLFVGKISIVE